MKFFIRKIFLILFISSFCLHQANAQNIELKNHSKDALYIRLNKKIGRINIPIETIIRPLELFDYKSNIGYINQIAVLPVNKHMFSVELLKIQTPTPYIDSLNQKLYLNLDNQNYTLSFDYNQNNIPKFYEGPAGFARDFSFLVVSDTHTIARNKREILRMTAKDLELYPEHTKQSLLDKLEDEKAVCNQMVNYIKDESKNIQAVVMPGDLAGGYGKKSETIAFKRNWYNPLRNAFLVNGGNIYLGIGNHDCYWESFFEPYPTKMLEFIKNKYDNYFYSFYISNVLFIHLGLHPAEYKEYLDIDKNSYAKGLDNSLNYLRAKLVEVDRNTPIIIFFHYPTEGSMSSWWSENDKNAFYRAIKHHNIILIITGHVHNCRTFTSFGGKFPELQAANAEKKFAKIKYNHLDPKNLTVKLIDADGNKESLSL